MVFILKTKFHFTNDCWSSNTKIPDRKGIERSYLILSQRYSYSYRKLALLGKIPKCSQSKILFGIETEVRKHTESFLSSKRGFPWNRLMLVYWCLAQARAAQSYWKANALALRNLSKRKAAERCWDLNPSKVSQSTSTLVRMVSAKLEKIP